MIPFAIGLGCGSLQCSTPCDLRFKAPSGGVEGRQRRSSPYTHPRADVADIARKTTGNSMGVGEYLTKLYETNTYPHHLVPISQATAQLVRGERFTVDCSTGLEAVCCHRAVDAVGILSKDFATGMLHREGLPVKSKLTPDTVSAANAQDISPSKAVR